jgi:hypothetical protein
LTQCPNATLDAPVLAIDYARRAAELVGYGDPHVLETLGDALAASGRTAEAGDVWSRALELAAGRDAQLEAALRKKLASLPARR